MREKILSGKPSVDKPWLKYYPQVLLDNLQVPACTVEQYLQFNMPGLDVSAMHYYGTEVTWQEVFVKSELAAKALKALGFAQCSGIYLLTAGGRKAWCFFADPRQYH